MSLPCVFQATLLYSIICLILPTPVLAQDDVIQWMFAAKPRGDGTVVFEAKATIRTGWHLYSQHLGEGGPIPTTIRFTPDTSFSLLDATKEYGDSVQYRDDLYDMEITWYSERVTFEQPVKVHSYPASISGVIEYMTCDDHTCIPSKRSFGVVIQNP